MAHVARAATVYWDRNSSTAGAGGATPNGTWNTSTANWNANSTGAGSVTTWSAGSTAIFSAGTDATGSYTATLGAAQTAGGLTFEDGTVTVTASTLTLNGAAAISVASGRTATIASTVAGGATAALATGQSKVIVTPSLTIDSGGKLDVSDNKLIVRGGGIGSWNGSAYTGMSGLIASGRNGGAWGGSGIITSMTDAIASNFTSVGVALALQVKALASATNTALWAGEPVTGGDTLVMYTYGGDANLDGKINVDDYGHIDTSIPLGVSGWFNGDFNYDGKVNVDDYGIIDFNIGIQGAPFATAANLNAVVAVPEPSVAGLLLAAMSGGVCRRRRRC
jgi:hypothetical protein